MSQDPIGFATGDTNLYALAYNDPVNLSDPAGTFPGWLIPMIVSTFNADPCPLGRFLAMVGGMGGSRIGLAVGVPLGATVGFAAGEGIEPLGGGFPGAFVGGVLGGGIGLSGGLALGAIAGGTAGDELGAILGMPGCAPNTSCEQPE